MRGWKVAHLKPGLTEKLPAYKVCRRGAVAQLGECLTGSQEVRGSIPLSSTNKINSLQSIKKN
jgi:hypothetical protein